MNEIDEIPIDVKRSFALKVARGMFNPVARHLRQDIAEDRLAEGIAMTFELYAKNAAEGRVIPDAILVQACHMRAIDLSRRVAGSQGCHPSATPTTRATTPTASSSSSASTPAARIWRGSPASASMSPARRTRRAGWRRRWTSSAGSGHWMAEDRLVLALRQAGSTLEEIGQACGKSINWARHRLLRLGYELAERAGLEVEMAA